jgi:hypothetical protein
MLPEARSISVVVDPLWQDYKFRTACFFSAVNISTTTGRLSAVEIADVELAKRISFAV